MRQYGGQEKIIIKNIHINIYTTAIIIRGGFSGQKINLLFPIFFFFADFDVFGPIFFYLLPLGLPSPLQKNGSPIFVLYKKSGKNLISDAGRGKRISDS